MKLREIHVRWIGIPLVALLATVIYNDHMPQATWIYRYFMSLCFTAVYWNGAYLIIKYFRKKFPEISSTQKRLIFSDVFLIIFLSVGGIPLKLIFEVEKWTNIFSWKDQSEFMPFNFVAGLVITLTYEAFYFFEKWKETFRQNEELKNRQIRTQYEVLQNQMSPHFLFNSLNTLASIIPEDADAAVSFTEKMSEVYRYILQNKERELVALEEEIAFAESYLFLLRMRFPDNLSIQFDVEKNHKKLNIPPLTLQMLIENAIKHNVVSKSKPLNIQIYVDNGK